MHIYVILWGWLSKRQLLFEMYNCVYGSLMHYSIVLYFDRYMYVHSQQCMQYYMFKLKYIIMAYCEALLLSSIRKLQHGTISSFLNGKRPNIVTYMAFVYMKKKPVHGWVWWGVVYIVHPLFVYPGPWMILFYGKYFWEQITNFRNCCLQFNFLYSLS